MEARGGRGGGVPAPHGAGPPPPGQRGGAELSLAPRALRSGRPPCAEPRPPTCPGDRGRSRSPPQPRRGPAPAAKLRDDSGERQRATRPGATRERSGADRPPGADPPSRPARTTPQPTPTCAAQPALKWAPSALPRPHWLNAGHGLALLAADKSVSAGGAGRAVIDAVPRLAPCPGPPPSPRSASLGQPAPGAPHPPGPPPRRQGPGREDPGVGPSPGTATGPPGPRDRRPGVGGGLAAGVARG